MIGEVRSILLGDPLPTYRVSLILPIRLYYVSHLLSYGCCYPLLSTETLITSNNKESQMPNGDQGRAYRIFGLLCPD